MSEALGFDQSYISMVEHGKNVVSLNLAKEIMSRYHVSVDWLLTGEGEMLMSPAEEAYHSTNHAPMDAPIDAPIKQSMQKTEVQEEAAAYGGRAGPPDPTQAALEGRLAALEAQQVRLQASIDTLTQLLAAYLRHEGKV